MKIKLIKITIMFVLIACGNKSQEIKNNDLDLSDEENEIDFNKLDWFNLINSEIVDFKVDLNEENVFILTEDKFLYKTSISNLQKSVKIELDKGQKIVLGNETIGIMDYSNDDSVVNFAEFNYDLINICNETFKFIRRTHLGDIQYSFFRRYDSLYYMIQGYNTVDILTESGVLYNKIELIDMKNGNQFKIKYGSCTKIKYKEETVLDLANYEYMKCDNESPIKIYDNKIYIRQNGSEFVKELDSKVDSFKIATNELYSNDNFTKNGGYLFEKNILHWVRWKH